MLSSFICGSFHNQLDDELDSYHICSSPKKSSKRLSSFKMKEPKNPYANRGLDKFDALLAEVDSKKQRIYTQKGAEDISLVRFVYSDDNKIKPIVVVKVKEKKPEKPVKPAEPEKIDTHNLKEKDSVESPKGKLQRSISEICQKPKRDLLCTKLEKLKQPSYLLLLITILILLLLAIYGRSFAIVCTSIGWYLIPSINGRNPTSRDQKKKKEYTRRLSDRKVVVKDGSSSPTSVINRLSSAEVSPRKHGDPHRKSF